MNKQSGVALLRRTVCLKISLKRSRPSENFSDGLFMLALF
ncbi:hypothetical protein NEIFL0001_0478 [Neisseria flavescens SK114]|nr:hypothetical protein NEIFL0001_0478 [Neisseria flavescens SK114]